MTTDSIKQFLSQQRVGAILKAHPREVCYLRTSSTAGDALEGLEKNHVLSEPVLDLNDEFAGSVSTSDLIRSFIHMIDEREGADWNERINEIKADEMLFLGRKFCDIPVDSLKHAGELWLLDADESSSLLDALLEGLRTQDPHVHHRLFVCSTAHGEAVRTSNNITTIAIKPGSERAAATGLKVLGVVSQSDVVQLLDENKGALGDAANATVEQLGLDSGAVFTISADMTALEAFHHMVRDHKSCLGIVDAQGKLAGNISGSDIRGLAPEDFPLLLLPAPQYLLAKAGKGGLSKEEALAGKQVQDALPLLRTALPIVSVGLDTKLGDLLDLLVNSHFHRVYVTDADGKPLSIVTLGDVLKLVTK